MMAGTELTIRAVRDQVASSVNLVVHQARLKDGARRVTHVTEVVGMEGDIITLQDVFAFNFRAGVDGQGRVLGTLQPTGLRPAFLEKLRDRGVTVSPALFAPQMGTVRS